MTQDLLERTVADWVLSDPKRGARELSRFASDGISVRRSPEEIVEALVQFAGRLDLAATRAW
jgi:hypothetical protein